MTAVATPPDDPTPPPREPGKRVLAELDREECWRLLRSRSLGRLVYTQAVLPAVVPVSYAVVDEELVVAATPGLKVAAAVRGAVVAFEVDDVDELHRTGWSVTAVGPARLLADPHLAVRLRGAGLVPWAPSPLATYVAISVRMLSGRHLEVEG